MIILKLIGAAICAVLVLVAALTLGIYLIGPIASLLEPLLQR
jgi:hypothetical protein